MMSVKSGPLGSRLLSREAWFRTFLHFRSAQAEFAGTRQHARPELPCSGLASLAFRRVVPSRKGHDLKAVQQRTFVKDGSHANSLRQRQRRRGKWSTHHSHE